MKFVARRKENRCIKYAKRIEKKVREKFTCDNTRCIIRASFELSNSTDRQAESASLHDLLRSCVPREES